MPLYRTYIIGRADHFWGAEDIDCADDQEAIQKVQQTWLSLARQDEIRCQRAQVLMNAR